MKTEVNLAWGLFTNYVYKKMWVGSPKVLTSCQHLYRTNVNTEGVGGQKKAGKRI